MPMLEHLLKLAADKPTCEPPAEKAEWERIFHPVLKNAGGRTVRFKRMRVFPMGEWAGKLDIAEIVAFLEGLMLCNPSPAKWPSPNAQHHARPALDSARSFDHFDVLSGRSKPFEGVRQRVPRVHVGGRRFDRRAMDEDFSLYEF
jgi:hypothetical protein